MELRRIDKILLKALYLVVTGIVVAQVLGVYSVTRMLFALTFPLTVLLWMRSVRLTVIGTDILMVITAVLAVVNVLVNAAAAGGSIGFNYLKKLIMFIMSLLFLQTAYRMRVDEDIVRFINKLVDFLTIYLIVMFLLQYRQMHVLNGRITAYLTFRFTNPNLTALFMVCLYMLKMYRLFSPGKWHVKLGHIAMAVFLAWFVLQTKSRNCLLVMLLFTAVSAWLIFRMNRKLYISRFWAVVIAVFPILLLVLYMSLVSNRWVQEMLSFMVDVGKGLDSRVEGWMAALNQLWESPLVGAYYEISYGTGESQMHNSHLDIAVSYGIPVLILVCALLTGYLRQRGRCYTDKSSYIYILGFACAITLGMGEAAVFSGGLGIYVFAGTFLLLANREITETEQVSV